MIHIRDHGAWIQYIAFCTDTDVCLTCCLGGSPCFHVSSVDAILGLPSVVHQKAADVASGKLLLLKKAVLMFVGNINTYLHCVQKCIFNCILMYVHILKYMCLRDFLVITYKHIFTRCLFPSQQNRSKRNSFCSYYA